MDPTAGCLLITTLLTTLPAPQHVDRVTNYYVCSTDTAIEILKMQYFQVDAQRTDTHGKSVCQVPTTETDEP